MRNVVPFQTLVARSFSTRIRDFTRDLEPISSCTSYVLGWVKSDILPAAASKTA